MGFGGRVRTIRKSLGLTLEQTAKRSKVSKSYLSQLENEKFSNPTTEVVMKLCGALGISVDSILGLGNNPRGIMSNINIPSHLRALAQEDHLNDKDITMLANISYQGKQPSSVDGWRAVLEAIRQSTEDVT